MKHRTTVNYQLMFYRCIFITYVAIINPVNFGKIDLSADLSAFYFSVFSAYSVITRQKIRAYKPSIENQKIRIIKFEKQNG